MVDAKPGDGGIGLTLEQVIAQAERNEDRIHDYVMSSSRTFHLGLIVLGFAGVALASAYPLAFVPIPFILTLIVAQGLVKDRETLALSAWQRALEIRIRDIAGEHLMIWESVVADRGQKDESSRVGRTSSLLFQSYAVFIAFTWVAGFLVLWLTEDLTWIDVEFLGGSARELDLSNWLAGLYSVLFIVSVIGLRRAQRNRHDLEERVSAHFNA